MTRVTPKERTVCKHGHEDWMYRRFMWKKNQNQGYWCWVCRECARLLNKDCSQRRRDRRKAQAAA